MRENFDEDEEDTEVIRGNAERARKTVAESASALTSTVERMASPKPPVPSRPGAMPHILVVEDQPSARRVFEELLVSAGYEMFCAADGEEALRMLEHERFDLVILDYVLPGRSGAIVGFEITQRWPRMPIIYTSGYPNVEHDIADLRPGAPFVSKEIVGNPQRQQILLDMIAALIEMAAR